MYQSSGSAGKGSHRTVCEVLEGRGDVGRSRGAETCNKLCARGRLVSHTYLGDILPGRLALQQ